MPVKKGDKIKVEYNYIDNTGNTRTETVERELSQIGSAPLASCSFDIVAGSFKIGIKKPRGMP